MSTRVMKDATPTARSRRGRRVVAATVVATVALTSASMLGAQSASAASAPLAQSVGNFVDGTLGGSPIQKLVKLQDATAFAPGTQTTQNPLNATLLNSLNLNLTHALQLPQLLGINLGVANQVAVAHEDGYSYGASGAVLNSGGVSVGGNDNAFPANATINLSASGIAGNSGLPIPGASSLGALPGASGITSSADALGAIKVSLGAVSALASTPTGVGTGSSTAYQVADITIQAGSPLLGGLLGNILGTGTTLLNSITKLLPAGSAIPPSCPLLHGTLPTISLEGGSITIDQTGTLTISLEKLLAYLGLDLNKLAPNTDLIEWLLNYLTSPTGLGNTIVSAINGLFNDLNSSLKDCTPTALESIITKLLGAGNQLETTIQNLINSVVTKLTSAIPAGVNPLAPLADVLKKIIDIGVNVQPNGPAGTFSSALSASPNQTTDPVAGQTVVRALEVDLLGGNKPAIALALANAAAGPSSGVSPTTAPPSNSVSASGTSVPTGVPAGFIKPSHGPSTPLILLIVGLLMAGGGGLAFRLRGQHSK